MTTARCPAAARCRWHDRAKLWLATGQTRRVSDNKDILLVLLERAWRGCTCGLVKRVKAAL